MTLLTTVEQGHNEVMRREFDWVTFDCYGTLIDWESGIRKAFLEAAAEDGVDLDPELVLRMYAAEEPVVEREPYRPYREVLAETATRVAHALGWRVSYAGFLADSLPGWRPFPDTNSALERLRSAGLRLGILSNIDDDLLAATRKHFTADFDLIVTAQQAGSYKPSPMHFLTARERIGGLRWIHAAESNYHDVVPANALGIATAWINRKSARPVTGGTPTVEFRDLAALADALA